MYKLHLLQHPDWHRTGTSYCYFYIFEIIHHHSVIFRKPTRPSLPLKKETFESLRLPLAKRRGFRKPTRPSLPLRKAPPLISVFSPQGRRGKPPYSVLGTATL